MDKINNFMARCHSKNTGLLLLRIATGSIFLVHGIMKLSNMKGTVGFFASFGVGSILAWMVAIIETVGGAFMILGIWTCVTGILLAIIMIFAIYLVKFQFGFAAYELEIMLMISSISIMLTGPGRYSTKWCCNICKNKSNCHDSKCGCDSKNKCDNCNECKDNKCTGHENK